MADVEIAQGLVDGLSRGRFRGRALGIVAQLLQVSMWSFGGHSLGDWALRSSGYGSAVPHVRARDHYRALSLQVDAGTGAVRLRTKAKLETMMSYFLGAGMALVGFGLGIFVTLMTVKFEWGCKARNERILREREERRG